MFKDKKNALLEDELTEGCLVARAFLKRSAAEAFCCFFETFDLGIMKSSMQVQWIIVEKLKGTSFRAARKLAGACFSAY